MDLALAHVVRAKLLEAGTELDGWQFTSLTHACRAAKERLLSATPPEAMPIVIASRGSQLLGSAVRTELTRAEHSGRHAAARSRSAERGRGE
jgi:hypothetical protein